MSLYNQQTNKVQSLLHILECIHYMVALNYIIALLCTLSSNAWHGIHSYHMIYE